MTAGFRHAPGIRRVAKDSAILTSATAISFACSLIALGLNTRSLGAEQFGRLALVQAYITFISGLTTFDNWQPVVRLGIRAPAKLGLIVGSGILLDLCATGVAAGISIVGIFAFSRVLGFGVELTWPLLVYCLSLLAGLGGTPKGYFRLEGRYDLLAQNQILSGVLQAGSSFVLWYMNAPFENYLVLFGLVCAIPGLTLVAIMVAALGQQGVIIAQPLKSHSHRRYLRKFLRMAAGNSILSTLATSRHQIALLIVSAFAGNVAAGLFAAASRCANGIARIVVPINQIMFPEIMRFARGRSAAAIRSAMRWMMLYGALGALMISAAGAFGSDYIVTLAAGTEFSEASGLFALLLMAEVSFWAGLHFNPIIIHSIGQKALLVLNLAVVLLTAVASTFLARTAGAWGVAATMLFAGLLTYLCLYFIAEHGIDQSSVQEERRRGTRG